MFFLAAGHVPLVVAGTVVFVDPFVIQVLGAVLQQLLKNSI